VNSERQGDAINVADDRVVAAGQFRIDLVQN
jgi:hypothetical protein